MKKIILMIVFIATSYVASGQAERNQVIISALYPYNYVSTNPAFTGLYGSRLTGMSSVYVPDNYAVSGAGLIQTEFDAKKINSGFGVAFSSATGVTTNNTYMMAMYSYRIKLGE